MKVKSLIVFFHIFSILSHPEPAVTSEQKAKAEAHFEIGTDSLERGYFKPRLRFEFPLKLGNVFIEMKYYQRANSKLEGEVDFWLNAGLEKKISNFVSFEVRINHMCRHLTSRRNPEVLDLNEVVAKFWLNKTNLRLGFGGGGYVGLNKNYRNLLHLNLVLLRILNTEFSAMAEFKFVNFEEILHEAELLYALNRSMDLYLKNTKHYEYDNRTYFGMKIKSGGEDDNYIYKFKFGTGLYPYYKTHKGVVENEINLEIFKTSVDRFIISMNAIIPIDRGDKPFKSWIDKMVYPLSVEYEKKLNDHLFSVVYCKYDIDMPANVDLKFDSSLGAGVGLRSQQNFERLTENVRFELFGGKNFTHSYDAAISFGVNTVKRSFNIGSDVKLRLNPEEFYGSFEIFGEFGKEICIRPFVAWERIFFLEDNKPSINRFLFGIELFRWF